MAARAWLLCVQALVLASLLAVPFEAAANVESDALLAFKERLIDPSGVLDSWDDSSPNPCLWFHITCNADDSVIRVDLGNATLGGLLVPELGSLASLQALNLFGNSISGSIPEELGDLANLTTLALYRNALSGTIPTTLGGLTELEFLLLDHNFLSGEIPSVLTTITTLRVVDLSYNFLTGSVPKFASTVNTSFGNNPFLEQ